MGQAFKIIMFLISNWKTIATLIQELSKLFKGESTKEAVQECLNGVCTAAEQKASQPRRRWRLFRRRK